MGLFDLETHGLIGWEFNHVSIDKVDLGFTKRTYRLGIHGNLDDTEGDSDIQPTYASNTAFSARGCWELGKFVETITVIDPVTGKKEESCIKGTSAYDPWLVENASVSDLKVTKPTDGFGWSYIKEGPFPWSAHLLSKAQKDELMVVLQRLPPEILLSAQDGEIFLATDAVKAKITHFPANGLTWQIEYRENSRKAWMEEVTRSRTTGQKYWSSDSCTVSDIKATSWYMGACTISFLRKGMYRFRVRSNFMSPSAEWSDWRCVSIAPVEAKAPQIKAKPRADDFKAPVVKRKSQQVPVRPKPVGAKAKRPKIKIRSAKG